MIKEWMKNLKAVNYEKNNESQFYAVEISERYFSTKLVTSETKCSVQHRELFGASKAVNELENLKFELWGQKEQLLYSNPWELVGTDEFIKMLEDYDITGYQIKKITIVEHNLSQSHVDKLKGIEIKGRVYAMCSSDGEEFDNGPRSGGAAEEERFKTRNGIMFRYEDWDGSDIFRLTSPGYIYVTDKFKNMIEKEEIKGIKFKLVKDLSFFNPIKDQYLKELAEKN